MFAAPLSQEARTIDALRAKAEADPSVLAGGAGAPAAAPEAADEPVAAEDVASTTDEAAPADSDNQTPAEDSATPEATADGTTEG